MRKAELVEFRILGPLEVIGADGPVLLRGAKRRGLLAFLLVHRGQVLPADRLAEALGDGESGSALGTIQTYLSQLRKVLPQVGGELLTRPGGYVFDVPDDAIDAARFETMVRAASTESDTGARLRLLDGALGLWRGAALEEFSWPWASTERSRLERRRLDALSLRAETRLERGEFLEALSELESLTEEYPLDERLCAQRMLAAYRAGRQADALRAFQQLRRNLAEELGVEPGPELVELERRVLDHDPALRADASSRQFDAVDLDAGAVETVGDYTDPLQSARAQLHLQLGLATVAVLITDLVGSARLRTELGAHRADELERWHEGILSRAVADYQGTVVKRLGDGAMAVFTTATDAVAAAAAIQTRLAREKSTLPADLRVRIGVSAGEVVVEADDVRGLPPTEAARLCARAEGGQILTTQLVQNLAAARSAASFEPVGVFDLKGLPGPVPLYEVPWPVGAGDVVPVPDGLTGAEEFAFVGRRRELHALTDAWSTACRQSELGSVLITGEAGAGKSRLTAEFATALGPDGSTILYGRCDEVAGYPFQPIAEWLRHYLAHASPAAVGMIRARHGAQLSRLVPELVSASVVADAVANAETGDPYPLYEAVLGWLTLVADAAPVLLVVDDLQWASGPTLAVLQHLIAAAPHLPGLLVATCRDDGAIDRDLAALLARTGAARRAVGRVELAGLEPDDVLAMVGQSHGTTAADPVRELAQEIYAESGGNPLFVTSLAQELESADLKRLRASRQPVRPPERVMELVVDRLNRLAPATVELLQKAAVTGTEFEFSLLRIVAEEPDNDRLLDLLADAVRERYLVELPGTPLRYRFPHGVVRNALLETVPVSQRMRLHRLAGRGLEQLGRAADDRTIASLAYHFSQAAGLGEVDRAIDYCRLAADVATQQLAHEEAVGWYRRALEVADAEGAADDTRYELLLALGRAQVYAGDDEARASLFRAYRLARDLDDATGAAEAVLTLNRGFFARTGETDEESVAALEATLAMFADEDEDRGTKAVLLAALASELVWAADGERRFAFSDDALAMARRAADPRALARVLGLRNMTINAPDTLGERTANCYELLGLAEEVQDDLIRFDAAFHRGGTALEAGDAEAAHDMVELAARVAERTRQPGLVWRARLMQTAQAVFRGALDDADYFAAEALALGRQAGQATDAFLFNTEQTFEIRRWQGRLGEFVDQLVPFAGNPAFDFGFALTRYLYEAGAEDAARLIYSDLVARGDFLPLRRDMLVTPSLYNLSFLAAREHDVATAEMLYDALRPYADAFANTTIGKPVGWHYLGLLAATMGKVDTAEAYLRHATTVHEEVGAPLFRAESEVELATVLLGNEREDDARPLLEHARATAQARGSELLTRACDALAVD